jgi:dCMP deaminase
MSELMPRDRYFLEMAKLASTRSKDPSTQTGAVIVDPKGRVVSTGYNGFPQRMPDWSEWYENREEKYARIVHCEMNAMIFAKRDLQDCTLYTWPFMSCDRCMVHMIQAGITTFICPIASADKLERWGAAFERTRQYVKDCSLVLREVEFP